MTAQACASSSLNNYDICYNPIQAVVSYIHKFTDRLQQTSTPQTLKYYDAPKIMNGICRIRAFQKLEKGWNGYDAAPIGQDVVENAISFFCELDEVPKIFPTGRNSIQFEHFINDDNLVEIEVYADHFEYFAVSNGAETEGSTSDRHEAVQVLNGIYG